MSPAARSTRSPTPDSTFERSPLTVTVRAVPYGHPDAQLLTDLVQAEYVVRYGSHDESPIDTAHFTLPDGYFVVAYDAGVPAAMGGWRRHDGREAEIKRMFVRDDFRRRGFARLILAHLEDSARENGFDRLVLETGLVQPEAVALYRDCGYTDVPAFGYYAGEPLSVHLGKSITTQEMSS